MIIRNYSVILIGLTMIFLIYIDNFLRVLGL